MLEFTLIRMVDAADHTFGRIEDAENRRVCYTLEEPWRDANGDGFGDTGVSRIPPGRYACRVAMSPSRGYAVPWIDGVPGRVAIQIHKGNTVDHTEGCVLVGTAFGALNGKPAVLHSKDAFARLMKAIGPATAFALTVKDTEYPTCKEAA